MPRPRYPSWLYTRLALTASGLAASGLVTPAHGVTPDDYQSPEAKATDSPTQPTVSNATTIRPKIRHMGISGPEISPPETSSPETSPPEVRRSEIKQAERTRPDVNLPESDHSNVKYPEVRRPHTNNSVAKKGVAPVTNSTPKLTPKSTPSATASDDIAPSSLSWDAPAARVPVAIDNAVAVSSDGSGSREPVMPRQLTPTAVTSSSFAGAVDDQPSSESIIESSDIDPFEKEQIEPIRFNAERYDIEVDQHEAQRISVVQSDIQPLGIDQAVAQPLGSERSKIEHAAVGDQNAPMLDQLPQGAIPQSHVFLPRQPQNDPMKLAQASDPSALQRIPQEPEPEPGVLPPLPDLLGPDLDLPTDETDLSLDQETVTISQFEVVGSTIFSDEELANTIASMWESGRPMTFGEILGVRSAITKLYVDAGYFTSGAIVPPQTFQDGGTAIIQVIEGSLEDIEIQGTRRLRRKYIHNRLDVGASTPLNIHSIVKRLRLLQLDPLIQDISTDLQAGTVDGTNRLVVTVTEADSFDANYTFDNNRSPSVGSMRHQVRLSEANLSGLGDRISIGYNGTTGSDGWDIGYTLPINPYNGTISFNASVTDSHVITEPFNVLDIESESESYELTVRQPLLQQPEQEFALGLTASHQTSQSFLGFDDIGPFPLSPGADENGQIKVSALRFFQDWTQRSNTEVIALRSQFNVGVGVFDATVNDEGPDSQFFSWQGQGQWVRSLGQDSSLLVRGGVQLATDSLLTLEQFGLGGQAMVRGYRQDELLTDNGVLASVEARFPIWRDRSRKSRLQIAPFLDMGHGWNNRGKDPETNTLVGVGAGLILNVTDHLNARLDYGIPLISVDSGKETLQENGLYFSLGLSL